MVWALGNNGRCGVSMAKVEDQVVTLNVQEDFAEKLATGRPVQAVAELVWNGLDAEATAIKVTAEDGELGLRSITVQDNGHGMSHEEAVSYFENLGGSWKKVTNLSKNGKRHLHGKEGRGRLRALALGRVAEWFVTGKDAVGTLMTFTVTIVRDDVRSARITAAEKAKAGSSPGTRVRISELDKDWKLDTDAVAQEFAEFFALYMTEYPGISISMLGRTIEPASAIAFKKSFALPSIERDGESFSASMDVIEWKLPTERMLYLCDDGGLPLHRVPPGIHAPGFEFSAYLKSAYNSRLSQQGTLDLAELDGGLEKAIEDGKEQLRSHFKARLAEDTRSRVERWKAESVYPYEDEPVSPIQRAERQVFDIVALNVATAMPEFETLDPRNKRFQLRMLKQGVENSPEEIQLIMTEVLGLPKQKQEELAKLLRKTTLAAVISSAKMVADRLEFLTGLEAMLFDADLKKHLKERSQLHKIVAENTWLFGEQFALTVSDQSLTEVLRKHLKEMGSDAIVDKPVKRLDGSTGIVDLFMTRKVPSARADERDYLVVELKAPSVKIGQKETGQVRSYAFAVQDDERFRNIKARWEFWVVSNDLTSYAKEEVSSSDRPYGMLHRKDGLQIWVRTWSEILNDCRTRLQLFEKELNYNADRDESLEFLQRTYAKILAGTSDNESETETSDDTGVGAPVPEVPLTVVQE
jgi:hypothetical protein